MPKIAKLTIYLETSVISAYFDFKKQDNLRKQQTRNFFKFELPKYLPFISEIVIQELIATKITRNRQLLLNLVQRIPILSFSQTAKKLRDIYMEANLMPQVKIDDAGHLAVAAVNNINIVLSWNYGHIANYFVQEKVNVINKLHHYPKLIIDFPAKFLTK